ncbi:MAG: sigma-70 family RNA polymerase sigma factor [Bacteroidota bacterium]|nr:sigma-70 family RNA polymerase sigma factor [Bacteroidota bacterium]
MSYQTELVSLDSLAARLPFAIDESDRVNEAFAAYMTAPVRAPRKREHRKTVDLWTYCYVRRYFLIKFMKESRFRASELDLVVERTFRKVEEARGRIEHHNRYAQWVSVVCRNTFINFVTRRQPVTGLEVHHDEAIDTGSPMDLDVNAAALHAALQRAIGELPNYLQATARMRFVENLSNEEIGRIVGKRSPTVRSYVHKINKRFRADGELCAWADHFLKQ